MLSNWESTGIIPPIRPQKSGIDSDRSPYKIQLTELVDQFVYTKQRYEIIKGLLNYRKELHKIGIISGFQWLDGSFMENIESLESRPPDDIDVVTFFNMPDGFTQQTLLAKNNDLFYSDKTKANFKVDSYYIELGQLSTEQYIRRISYWYSIWSHRRNGIWKGYIQVDLSDSMDEHVLKMLEQKLTEEGLS